MGWHGATRELLRCMHSSVCDCDALCTWCTVFLFPFPFLEAGASLGIEFTGLTFDENHFGIYIQSVADGSCASLSKKLQ